MIGKEIGNHRILKELGKGGMGIVYKAHQLSLGRSVAMKVLPRHLTNDASFIKRFHNEARAIARLNHPNIVQIYDIGHEDDIHYRPYSR
jgi:serine/threonine-protein kinase